MVCIGSGGTGSDKGGAAAQAPADGDLRLHGDAQARHGQAQLGKHGLVGDHGQVLRRSIFRVNTLEIQPLGQLLKGEGVIKGQGQTQGIKAGAQIGGGSGNADGYHCASPAFAEHSPACPPGR